MNLNLLKKAIVASIEAGEAILEIYNKDFEIYEKSDASPLTEADLLSNQIITEHLLTTSIPIVSEENKVLSYEERKQWSQCWVVDPIDGTKEFIKKNGEFTVNIALVQNGITQLGVIYVPVTKELYYTNLDKSKSFKSIIELRDLLDITSKICLAKDEIQPAKPDDSNIKVVGSRSHMNDDTLNFVEDLKKSYTNIEIVSKGSSLKFCLVAEGKAHVYPRFAPTMEWDTAAGQAICEAAGLQVIDQGTQKPMLYNREDLLNNYFLVTL